MGQLLRASGMPTIARKFDGLAGVVTISTAILAVRRCVTVTGGVSALLISGHESSSQPQGTTTCAGESVPEGTGQSAGGPGGRSEGRVESTRQITENKESKKESPSETGRPRRTRLS
jgi:hypothetical protein